MRLSILACLPLALAVPFVSRQSNSTSTNSSAPSVTFYPATSNGQPITVTGTRFASFGQDVYRGIPYAAPPVGDLRFKPPQDVTYNSTFAALKEPPGCLQNPNKSSSGISEDCLYLDVYTPAGANGQTAWLPVFVWVYGGSFDSGSTAPYNASVMLGYGLQTSRPFVYVSFNYRLGILGFGNGAEIAANGAANLGLRDVKQALQWVQDNIWAFGGDPSQVTVFGQSAGAILISLLYLEPSISLFKGAIMESGSQSVSPIGPTAEIFNGAYNYLVQAANCTVSNSTNSTTSSNSTSSTNSTSSGNSSYASSFDCLKALPADALIKAQLTTQAQIQYSGFVFSPSIDGDLIPSSPHDLLQNGQFAQIPFMTGTVRDEGSGFIPTFVSSESQVGLFFDILEPTPISNETFAQIVYYYPDDPSLGCPFGTGNNTFGLAPEWKQAAAILNDVAFESSKRWFLQSALQNSSLNTWGFFFNQTTPQSIQTPRLGIAHASDVPYVYGLPLLNISSYNYTQQDAAVSKNMIDYWLNFLYYTDPSPANSPVANLTNWPTYGTAKNLLQFQFGNTIVIPDTYREQNISFFNQDASALNKRHLLTGLLGLGGGIMDAE